MGNVLAVGAQGRQLHHRAAEPVQQMPAPLRQALPRRQGAGEHQAVALLEVGVLDGAEQLHEPVFLQRLHMGEAHRPAAVLQGRGVAAQQVVKTLLLQQGAVHLADGRMLQGAAAVDEAGHLLRAGARLPQEHQGRAGARVLLKQLGRGGLGGPVEAVEEVIHDLLLVQEADAVLLQAGAGAAGVQREGGVAARPRLDALAGEDVLAASEGDGGPLQPLLHHDGMAGLHPGGHGVGQRLPQGGEDLPPVLIQHHGVRRAGGQGSLQHAAVLPLGQKNPADAHRLAQGHGDTLAAGGDQQGGNPRLPGQGVGHHVAQHHGALLAGQPLQGGPGLPLVADGADLHIVLQHVAQEIGAAGDGREAHHGVAAVAALGQADGAQDVIHAQLDLHHRQGGFLPQQLRRAAAGKDHVNILVSIAGGDGRARLQVAHKGGQFHVLHLRSQLYHQAAHALVGRNAQYACHGHIRPLPFCWYPLG